MRFGRNKSQVTTAGTERPVATAYVYADNLAQRARALFYGASPLVGDARMMGMLLVREGDGYWIMSTTDSRAFQLLLLYFTDVTEALADDSAIRVKGYARDKTDGSFPYPDPDHEFENPQQMKSWLDSIGPSHHTWDRYVKSLKFKVGGRI